ncbi:MAG: barstar family protein [Zoogloeaceae bacterium]|jgi:RNAse (barnase) inhibitor barstar|nr:barstar family protein [Zoogloeaceae bacterium]
MSRRSYAPLLRQASRSGVYRAPRRGAASLIADAKAAGLAAFHIDLAAVRDKDALLDRIAETLSFPDWFGHNWDALADCLGDLSWLPAHGYFILLTHCGDFRARDGAAFAAALPVFAAAAEVWRGQGVPFWTLADARSDGLAGLPGPE